MPDEHGSPTDDELAAMDPAALIEEVKFLREWRARDRVLLHQAQSTASYRERRLWAAVHGNRRRVNYDEPMSNDEYAGLCAIVDWLAQERS